MELGERDRDHPASAHLHRLDREGVGRHGRCRCDCIADRRGCRETVEIVGPNGPTVMLFELADDDPRGLVAVTVNVQEAAHDGGSAERDAAARAEPDPRAKRDLLSTLVAGGLTLAALRVGQAQGDSCEKGGMACLR